MALIQGESGLTIRALTEGSAKAAICGKRQASAWIDELPVIDTGESAERVFHLLHELNQCPIDAKKRFDTLETLAPVCCELIKTLSKVYEHNPLKYSLKLQTASELAHAIASEQVFGYSRVVEDICSDEALTKKYEASLIPLASSFALTFLGQIQLQRYQLYKTVGNKIYSQQNALYTLSRTYDFTTTKLKSNTLDIKSFEQQLLTNLLMSIANPYQLKHGQISDVYEFLGETTQYTHLNDIPEDDTLFVYLPNKDIAPQAKTSLDASAMENALGLNIDKLVELLNAKTLSPDKNIFSLFKQKKPFSMEDSLYAHLVEHWSKVKARNFIRVKSDETTEVAIGVAASHHFLVKKAGASLHSRFFGDDDNNESHFKIADISVEDDGGQHGFVWNRSNPGLNTGSQPTGSQDAFSSIYKPKSHEERKAKKENLPFNKITTSSRYQWVSGLIKDISPTGFCLAFEKAPSVYSETNEIITIKTYQQGREVYSLGMIRWNRWHRDDIFLLGIELIAPESTPVRATLDWDYAKPDYHHNGLLLPEMPRAGIDSTIILPPLGYRSGQVVAIMTPDEEIKIELGKKIIETDNFIQYLYSIK